VAASCCPLISFTILPFSFSCGGDMKSTIHPKMKKKEKNNLKILIN
jgi:hypothetical protein